MEKVSVLSSKVSVLCGKVSVLCCKIKLVYCVVKLSNAPFLLLYLVVCSRDFIQGMALSYYIYASAPAVV